MKPKILVVIRWPVGGIRTWCRYVYRDPRFAKYDIEMILPDDTEGAWLKSDLADSSVRLTLQEGVSSTSAFSVRVAKRVLSGGFDFVHSHGFTSGLASMIPAKLARVPHLVTPHDVVLDWQYRSFKRRVARVMIGAMLRRASRVQAVGEAAAMNLRQAFSIHEPSGPRIDVVRNGIDVARFVNSEPEDVRTPLGIPEDAIVVGFFGRFMAQKGFRYIVEAIEMHQQTPLSERPIVVVAVGGGGYRREEEHFVKSKNLERYFRFLDFAPNIAGMLKGVDMVVMPSLWEACPLLPMEALASGTPLIVSDFDACLEVVSGSPAAVVPVRDAKAILEAIIDSARQERVELATSYVPEAVRRFDVSSTISGMADLYEEMCRQKRCA